MMASSSRLAKSAMISFSKPPFCLIAVYLFIAVFWLSTSVRGESSNNHILLPSDRDNGAICPPIQESPASCPIKCFRTVPVCGVDGVTYWCGCADAHCNGVQVARLGFCDAGNGGAGPISGQAFLLVHIIWLILLGIFVLFGFL